MSMENVRKIEMKSGQGDDAEIKSVFGAKKSEGKVSTLRVFIVAIRLSMAVNGILLTICTFHFPATYLLSFSIRWLASDQKAYSKI